MGGMEAGTMKTLKNKRHMHLIRRDCAIKMRLVPYGSGWTDVYIDFGDGEEYFVISNVMGAGFEALMRALYYLHPFHNNDEEAGDIIDYKDGVCDYINGKFIVTKVVDDIHEAGIEVPYTYRRIPWKAHFTWDEEGCEYHWSLEKEANEDESFMIKLRIESNRDGLKAFDFQFPYEDLCYAVADASTKALKRHGFFGYHSSTYTEDINLRYLLFLKAVALRNMEACQVTRYPEKGKGDTSSFTKEMELLLFDM